MSRVGKLPIKLPEGVSSSLGEGRKLVVSGPKGVLDMTLPKNMEAKIDNGLITFEFKAGRKSNSSLYGTIRSKVANMVKGVSEGWTKQLELVGTGYRAEVAGSILTLAVGYSHPVKIAAPDGVTFKVEKTAITIDGSDKEVVGQTAAKIRFVRPPEPYKGKGIKYRNEIIRKKAGKAAKAAGAPGAV